MELHLNFIDLPPLSALRAFEAAARNGSLSAAARELNVTHAAVAQQVKRLEVRLGKKLLERAGRGVAPTAHGTQLATGLSEGFGVIAESVRKLTRDDETRPLRITVTPTVAAHWLMPRLARFREEAPGLELMVHPAIEVVDILREDYDVAMRFGRGSWPGLEAMRMVASDVVLVATEELLERQPIDTPADLITAPWIQESGTEEVRLWLAQHGLDNAEVRNVLHLPGHLAVDALRGGQGVGLTARAWVASDIAAGRLKVLFAREGDPKLGYYVVFPPAPHRTPLKRFLSWITREIAADARTLPDLPGP